MKTKITIISFMVCLILQQVSWAQNKNDRTRQDNNGEIKSQEEKDWEHLDHMKNFFCKAPEGCERVDKANLLEYLKYEDKLKVNRSILAEDFLNKYPNSKHYDKALSLFLSVYFMPLFIPEHLDRNTTELISRLPRKGSAEVWLQAYRFLPIDFEKRDEWLKKGDNFIAKILNSNAPIEYKAKVEVRLYNRDITLALKKFTYLPKTPLESDYWKSLEKPYWDPMWNRLLGILEKYPDSEMVAQYVMAILERFKQFSPELSETYAKEALEISGRDSLYNRKGYKLLHMAIIDNLKATETLKAIPNDKPLEMNFIAMDGSKVDLVEMRGKVVLIDFWSTRCPPCIKEMPHVKVLYDKYKKEGFEVIGIADNNKGSKDLVLKIMEKTGADWPQRLDKGSNTGISYHSLYNIKSLPTVWLLDKKGKIVDKNARGQRLEPLIRKYLDLKN